MCCLRIFLVFFAFQFQNLFSNDRLIEAIQDQNISEITRYFDELGSISLDDAHELLTTLYEHYIAEFGSDLLGEEYFHNLEQFKTLYHSLLASKGLMDENLFIKNDSSHSTTILFCRQKKETTTAGEIPGSIVLGGVEVLVGSLVWILPFPGTKQLGGVIVADGIRRTLNGLEEIDKENKDQRSSEENSALKPQEYYTENWETTTSNLRV